MGLDETNVNEQDNLFGTESKLESFSKLVRKDIPNILSSNNQVIDDYDVEFEYLGYSENDVRYDDGTLYSMMDTKVKIINRVTGYKIESIINMMNVPVMSDIGLTINDRAVQVLTDYISADGWSVSDAKKTEDLEVFATNSTKFFKTLDYKCASGQNFSFMQKNNKIVVILKIKGKEKTVALDDFLRVLSGKTTKDLSILLGSNIIIQNSLSSKEKPLNKVITTMAKALAPNMKNTDVTFQANHLRDKFLSKNLMKINGASRVRLQNLINFKSRAEGKVLAKSLELNGRVLPEGQLLSADLLNEIDDSSITCIYVKYNDKVYDLRKYKCKEDQLTVEELFTVINIYAGALEGFDTVGGMYDLTARVNVSYFDKVRIEINGVASRLVNNIKDEILKKSDDIDINLCRLLVMARRDVRPDSFIKSIKEDATGVMQNAELINIPARMSKDYKASADIKNATDDVTKMQYNQRNRTDPVDSPESNKIGLVHSKAYHAREDENGFLVTPYVLLCNGKVLLDDSGKPKVKYLTAIDEGKQYVAPWDADLDKETIKVFYDETVISVPTKEVKYMEYSPFQQGSFVRNLVPFPNFSNPKRLLMAANHHKQAIDIVSSERPYTDTGMSSLVNFGYITAEEILKRHYSKYSDSLSTRYTEDEFIGMQLELISTEIVKDIRKYRFETVVDNKEDKLVIVLDEYFMKKTDKSSVYSFDINESKGNIYQGTDIVLYNTGMDIKGAKIDACMDYGFFKIGEEKLQVSLALSRNLLVGFKTYESSNIDDSIAIREDLAYGGVLSSVMLTEVKCNLISNNKIDEKFIYQSGKDKRIAENGLPKIGTVFEPGDDIIYKERTKLDKFVKGTDKPLTAPVTETLDNNTYGEVVYAKVETVKSNNNKGQSKQAVVILANIGTIEAGDKLAGRYGNKGVISKLIPTPDMPYVESTGEILDVTLNPLGIPSRMNISQILEVVLSLAERRKSERTGERHVAIVSPFHPDSLKFVKERAEEEGVKPEYLIDGRTGERIKRPVNFGIMYMLKLEHIVKKKVHAIGRTSSVNSRTLQPKDGKGNNGGQTMGEMETWAFLSNNCPKILQYLLSTASDDLNALDQLDEQMGSRIFRKSSGNKAILPNQHSIGKIQGENRNIDTLQYAYRCLGVEFERTETGDPIFRPLKDEEISLMGEEVKCEKDAALHSQDKVRASMDARRDWSHIKLASRMVSPFWILDDESESIFKTMICRKFDRFKESDNGQREKIYTLTNISSNMVKRILQVGLNNDREQDRFFVDFETTDGIPLITPQSAVPSPTAITGLDAILNLLETSSFDKSINYYKSKLIPDETKDNIDMTDKEVAQAAAMVNKITRLRDSGVKYTDFIFSHFPIIPEIFRPAMQDFGQKSDYDIHYQNIMNANRNLEGTYTETTRMELFKAIAGLQGYLRDKEDPVGICQVIFGKESGDNVKNYIRDEVLSKILHYSGRSVITPMQNINMRVDELGVPFIMAHKIWENSLRSILADEESPLIQFKGLNPNSTISSDVLKDIITSVVTGNVLGFKSRLKNLSLDITGYGQLFFDIKKYLIDFLETRMVILGRQPTLHKHNIRACYVKITFGRAIEINPMLCTGYNADFDGDQMYIIGLMTSECMQEAIDNLLPMCHVINVKDGSIVLEHTQDQILGCYFATMLHDNKLSIFNKDANGNNIIDSRYEDIYTFGSIEELDNAVTCCMIEYQDLATVQVDGRWYLSTAGRILFNSLFPDAFTTSVFTNPLNIPNVSKDDFFDLKYDGLVAKSKRHEGYISLSGLTSKLYLDTTSGQSTDILKSTDINSLETSISEFVNKGVIPEKDYSRLIDKINKKVQDDYRRIVSSLLVNRFKLLKGDIFLVLNRDTFITALDMSKKLFSERGISRIIDSLSQCSKLSDGDKLLLSNYLTGESSTVGEAISVDAIPYINNGIVSAIIEDTVDNSSAIINTLFSGDVILSKDLVLNTVDLISDKLLISSEDIAKLISDLGVAVSDVLRDEIDEYLTYVSFQVRKDFIDLLLLKNRDRELSSLRGSFSEDTLGMASTMDRVEILQIFDYLDFANVKTIYTRVLKNRLDFETKEDFARDILELADSDEEIYNNLLVKFRQEKVLVIFQKILIFGFMKCDISGITLGLDDVDTEKIMNRDESEPDSIKNKMSKAHDICEEIDSYYSLGLLSESERKDALIRINSDLCKDTQNQILEGMDRNNNLYIISDSGARGSTSQIMQTVGIIGVSMKTLTESMEVPILSSYASGLTSTEMVIASYGARAGVVSTQKGTPEAGYATRKSVMMLAGFTIKAHDCGKEVKPFELQYTLPHSIEFTQNGITNKKETELKDSTRELDDIMIGYKLVPGRNLEFSHLFKYILDDTSGALNKACVQQIFKHHIKQVVATDGKSEVIFNIRYRLDTTMRNLLVGRVCEPKAGEYIGGLKYVGDYRFSTDKTIKWIEKDNPEVIRIRLMLDCNCVGGVCAKCFGLTLDTGVLPEVGQNMGVESAQALGEPIAQMVMSLFHKGGLAGTSVSSGVTVYNAIVDGHMPGSDKKKVLSTAEGYVNLFNLGKKTLITIEDTDYKQEVDTNFLCVVDGEYVKVNDPLTQGMLDPSQLGVDYNRELEWHGEEEYTLLLKKHYLLVDAYYKVFEANGIDIFARHFEVLSRFQASLVEIIKADPKGVLKVGELYEIEEAKKLLEDNDETLDDMQYFYSYKGKAEVVQYYSGPTASIAFEYGRKNVMHQVVARPRNTGKSFIEDLASSRDITNPTRFVEPAKASSYTSLEYIKHFDKPVKDKEPVLDNTVVNFDDFDVSKMESFGDLDFNIDGIIQESSVDESYINDESNDNNKVLDLDKKETDTVKPEELFVEEETSERDSSAGSKMDAF